ncbi:MAG: phosphate ABC transporter substrate-binding protein [Lactobacillus sp.]|nr:phosphate ABC transporter substrate-binding protein [Lactobacillus sp.]
MKKKALIMLALSATALLTLVAGCGSQSTAKSSDAATKADAKSAKIVAVGSTALQPLVEQAASTYQDDHPEVKLTVQGGGSGTGLSQVVQGAVTIGNSDIFAEQGQGVDASKLVDHQVAVVGMAPVTNPDVGIKNLKMNQLQEIFTGKITNWKQVGGKDEAITVINRAQGSGTRATFEAAVLKGQKAMTSQEQDSNGTVQKIVAQTPGAISYLAFSYIKSDLQALSVDNVAPTAKNVTTDAWKIWSYEHMYTKGKPNSATAAFLQYINSKPVQKSLVTKLGYISIHDMQVQKSADNQVTKK